MGAVSRSVAARVVECRSPRTGSLPAKQLLEHSSSAELEPWPAHSSTGRAVGCRDGPAVLARRGCAERAPAAVILLSRTGLSTGILYEYE